MNPFNQEIRKHFYRTAAAVLTVSLLSGCSLPMPLGSAASSAAPDTTAESSGQIPAQQTAGNSEEFISPDADALENGTVETLHTDDLKITVTYPERDEEPAAAPASVTPALGNTAAKEKAAANDAEAVSSTQADTVKSKNLAGQDFYRTNRFWNVGSLDKLIENRLTVDLIRPSEFSRAGNILTDITSVAVHYLANPGTNAKDNRDYFDSLADSGAEYASCHFIVGLEGEILQLIPTNEISLATNDFNMNSISIECCHPDASGYYNDETYDSLVLLTAWLLDQFGLTYNDIVRHFDANGKICPRAFVEDPDYWFQFKFDVACAMGYKTTMKHVIDIADEEFLTHEEVEERYARQAEEAAEAEYYASQNSEDFQVYDEEYSGEVYYEDGSYDEGYSEEYVEDGSYDNGYSEEYVDDGSYDDGYSEEYNENGSTGE